MIEKRHKPTNVLTWTASGLIGVSLLLGFAQAIQAAAANDKPAKLEHMDYFHARKIILGYGWKPLSGPCGGASVSNETCARFPEIESCSGVSPGYCAMVFAKQNKCLYVTTTGGEPEEREGDTHVEEVTVGRGPCSKT